MFFALVNISFRSRPCLQIPPQLWAHLTFSPAAGQSAASERAHRHRCQGKTECATQSAHVRRRAVANRLFPSFTFFSQNIYILGKES